MVATIRYAILDDEPAAISVTKTLMQRQSGFVCVADWTSPQQALEQFTTLSPDLLFLDVEMPLMTGLEFLRQLPQPPTTILVTAFPEYAIDAFSLGVREYVLKPMSPERLSLALANIRPLLDRPKSQTANVLAFKDGYQQTFIDPTQIIKVAAEGNFSALKLVSGQSQLVSESLRELTQRLEGFGFIRIHKSSLVNVQHVKASSRSQITLSDGSKVAVGRAYQDNVRRVL